MLQRACNRQAISLGTVLRGVTPVLLSAVPMLMVAGWLDSYWPVSSFADLALQGIIAAFCYACLVSFGGIHRHERTRIIHGLERFLHIRSLPAVLNMGNRHG